MNIEESILWRIKVRLQFTGWLQYLPSLVVATFALVLALLGWWIGVWPGLLLWTPLAIGSALLLVFVFDVVTVKFGLRPSERLPARLDTLDTFEVMRARHSCRSFQIRDLTPSDHAELMACVEAQTRAEARIGEAPIRFEYIAAPLTVWPVVRAHEFLVAIAPREYDRLAILDVGRSLQKVVLHATRMGLATCWIGPGADQASIVHHLGERFDPERDHVVCVCAVGYASSFMPLMVRSLPLIQHRRLPLSSLFFADPQCQTPLDLGAPPFDRFARCYEGCQWSPSSYNSQTTRCAGLVDHSGGERPRFDFFAATGSRYYAPVALGIWCADWESGCEALAIPGRFRVLTPEQRGLAEDAPALPRYDISWIPDEPDGSR